MTSQLRFGYLNFQARGQVSRLLLAYTKTNYKQTSYSFSNIQEWLQIDKQTLNLDFPSLPYLIAGSLKLTQSKAIQLYIIHRAHRTDLLGRNIKEKALIENINGVLKDIFNSMASLFTTKNMNQSRKQVFQSISPKLNYLNDKIGQGKYLLTRLTYCDFVLNVVSNYLVFFFPFQFEKWTNIKRAAQNVNNLQEIQDYYKNQSSISNLLPPQRVNSPEFLNFKPIEIQPEQSQQNNQEIKLAQFPSLQIIQQQQHAFILDTNEAQINLNQTSRFEILQQPSSNQQFQLLNFENQNLKTNKFTSKVSDYLKAAEASDQKGTQLIKSKLIPSTSKIQAVNKLQQISQSTWKHKQNNQQLKSQQNRTKITLGYWGIRGLGQVQRHLLQFCGVDFDEKTYTEQESWFNKDKNNLALLFPNLPYLTQESFKITQSLAIDRYIIRISGKTQLLGKNLKDQMLIENTVKILSELFRELRVLCATQDPNHKKRLELLAKYAPALQKLNSLIKENSYCFGYLTWTDFYISEISHYMQKIYPQDYKKYAFFNSIRKIVQSSEQIKKYYERPTAIKAPFMPPSAKIFF